MGRAAGKSAESALRGGFRCKMANKDIVESARQVAGPVISGMGYELVDLRYVCDGGRWCLRFFIDKPGGIGTDDCERVSREIETLLEVEEVISGPYVLEVSSPGLDRPLFTPADFERFEGSLAKIRTKAAIEGQKVFVGRIVSPVTDGFDLALSGGKKTLHIKYDQVQKANLEIEF